MVAELQPINANSRVLSFMDVIWLQRAKRVSPAIIEQLLKLLTLEERLRVSVQIERLPRA